MDYSFIKYEVAERILTITLNRPDKMNAFNPQMCDEIIDALNKADEDDDIRAIIFTGAGKAFCAGSDLSGAGATFDYSASNVFDYRDTGGRIALRLYEMKKPVIAAINGAAVGVGITMTLPMDIRICSEKSKIGFVFASRGIVNEACSGWFLPRTVGMSKAMEWMATGRLITGQEAYDSKLVSYVLPTEEVYEKALEIARQIVKNTAPVSVALSRQLMWKMLGEDHPMQSHKIESMILQWGGNKKDAEEGVNSFLEKRDANYTMKPSEDMPEFYPWSPEKEFPKNF